MNKSTKIVHPLKVRNNDIINYSYLIVDDISKDSLLIDPAWEADVIEDKIMETKSNLKAILLTHHHVDHTGLASYFSEKYSIPVYMSKNEIEYYEFKCCNLNPIESEKLIYIDRFEVFPYFTPGHTKGSISYMIEENFFTGDTLFIEGCGICVGKGASASEMFESLQKIKVKIKSNAKIFPGHLFNDEIGMTFNHLLKNNIYMQIDNLTTFISFRMRKNQINLFKFK